MSPQIGPFVLQSLIQNVPLSAEGEDDDVKINCVEFLDQNLYVGTSAAEILHFVQLPPESPSEQPTFILASRLPPSFAIGSSTASRPGIQQILLLPNINKACILCNYTVTFYSLPELSPVYEGVQVRNCNWIGGVDLNVDHRSPAPQGVTILLSHNSGIRVIRLRDEEPRKIRSVEFASSILSVRRDSFACVADARSYALLDVDRRLKIPLFPISSLDDVPIGNVGGYAEDISGDHRGHQHTLSADSRGHRHTPSGDGNNRYSFYGRETPDRIFRQPSPSPSAEGADKPLPIPPATDALLKPHIVSPNPQEFLLTTGTGLREPGVGMFVNLEGDVTRSTLEFDHYPEGIVADGRGVGVDLTPANAEDDEEGYILAVMTREIDGSFSRGLEIQRWDLDFEQKHWLELYTSGDAQSSVVKSDLGIRSVVGAGEIYFDEVVDRLCLKRFLGEGEDDEDRMEEERSFARRLAQSRSKTVVWFEDSVSWVVRNPLALRFEFDIDDRKHIVASLASLRGREARTEAEFVSLGYIRQLAGLALVISFLKSGHPTDEEFSAAEESLLEGGLDPRIVLAMIPELCSEVLQSESGIWVHGGVRDLAKTYQGSGTLNDHVLLFLRRYLAASRKRKGYGSTANEDQVFQSIDAALLIVLLELDKTPSNKVRGELNKLVDEGLDCFDRAVSILETYQRLYVLSRLYQSRRMTNEVLATWKRIILGEPDQGGEFVDGEQRLREHLARLSNAALVQEYGVWLAARNPKLGVQVFADDHSKVKFNPIEVVAVLRKGAPSAVKEYLEFLVFGKHHTEYVDELIAYYMDIVLGKLESSQEARDMLVQSSEAYRALRAPKPTYRHFLADNGIPDEWWQSRLRLLQLLGGGHGDVDTIRSRIEPYLKELVPEAIILDGRQGRHAEALTLLVHSLGDYDSALRYCLGAGSDHSLARRDEQAKLFGLLLAELLKIEDLSDRVEQTSILLERFGGWLDVGYVLSVIPDSWSVELVSGFLVSALRRVMKERSETMVAKSLRAVENLRVNADLVDKIEAVGPNVQDDGQG